MLKKIKRGKTQENLTEIDKFERNIKNAIYMISRLKVTEEEKEILIISLESISEIISGNYRGTAK